MRLLRLLTAGAVIGGAVVLIKRVMEQMQEDGATQSGTSGPAPAPSRGTSGSAAAATSSGGSQGRASSNGGEPTKAELYERAQELGIEGRSKMSKRELQRAIEAAG